MKFRKNLLALALVLVLLSLSLAACAPRSEEEQTPAAAEDVVFENGGMQLTIPAAYADLVVVDAQPEEESVFFSVSEKASVEAGEAVHPGEDWGDGWLFSIGRVDPAQLKELRTNDMSGADVFAKDAEHYYIWYHPTDVRIMREGDITEADTAGWTEINEWANSVRETFVAENTGLEPVEMTNTELDIHLYRVAYLDDVPFTISTPASGPLEPGGVDKTPFVEQLLNGVTFEWTDDAEVPDGESVTLALQDGDMDVRIDFFAADGNVIRVTRTFPDGEETFADEALYIAHYADGATVAHDVMQGWYDALAAANA